MRYNMIMVIFGVLAWWYTDGWKQCLLRVRDRFVATADYFSIGLLLKTLFAPFRQISAGTVDGPFEAKLQAFFDQLISRFIGAAARLVVMAIGIVTIILGAVAGGVTLILWVFVPFLPIVGLILFALGWLPWNQ